MPLLLELFAGTHSMGKAFREAGWDVFSVDIDPARNATWTGDVLGRSLSIMEHVRIDLNLKFT